MANVVQRILLSTIEERGRRQGAPTVTFPDRRISSPGEDIYVSPTLIQRLFLISAFYLTLPPNAFGVLVYPNGTSRNMEGGLCEVPPGLYKIQYVDKQERHEFTSAVPEMTVDGEKLSLRVMFRYRVVDPIVTLRIDRPVATLIEHIESDVAQYIRTHNHDDIADPSDDSGGSKLLSFFVQRHNRRFPLSKAIIITGVELKDFTGDKEYVEMRRSAVTQERQVRIDKEHVDRQKELERLRTEFQTEIEKIKTKAAAEKEVLQKEILHESHKRDIELDDMRAQSRWRHELVTKAVDAIGQALEPSGYPRNTNEIKVIISELLAALKEDTQGPEQPATAGARAASSAPSFASSSARIEKLTNTLLGLLKPPK